MSLNEVIAVEDLILADLSELPSVTASLVVRAVHYDSQVAHLDIDLPGLCDALEALEELEVR